MIDSILKSDGEYEEYIIYHDESGVYKTDRYFFTGILYVKSNFQAEIITLLNRIRQEENYYREIHFKKIKGFTPKFNVAKKWLNLAERLLGTGKIYFTCQIVDTYHTNFDHTRFKKKFHAYNRLTAMAITSSIAWHLKRKETIHMQMVSDEKSRRPEGEIVKIDRDNFEDYIPSRINYDSIRHTFPKKLNFNSKVIVISSHGLEIKNQFLQQIGRASCRERV